MVCVSHSRTVRYGEPGVSGNGTRALLWPNAAEAGQVRVLVRFGRGYQAVAPDKGGLLCLDQWCLAKMALVS